MKILIRNPDHVVIYAQDDLHLDTEAHGNGWRDPNFNTSNATLADATLPALWTGADWTYNAGTWTPVDSASYAAKVAAKTAQAAQNLQSSIVTATQERLDSFTATRGYDGILSACTYAASTVPRFAADAQRCISLRDTTWAALYALLADVQAGTKPMPASFADVAPLLPVLSWA